MADCSVDVLSFVGHIRRQEGRWNPFFLVTSGIDAACQEIVLITYLPYCVCYQYIH